MAITQVGTATTGFDNGGDASFSVTKPTGVASGDILIAFGASNANAWSTIPSGFTQFTVSTDASMPSGTFRVYGWYKVCGGSEPSSYTFESTAAGSAGAGVCVAMTAYRGVDTSSPIAHSSTDHLGSLGPSDGNPSVTFSQSAQGLLIFARGARSSTALPTFSTSTSNWAETAEVNVASGTGSIRYGIGYYDHDTETGSGTQTEPGVPCNTDTTDNFYFLGVLRSAPEGSMSATVPSITSAFAGHHRIDATMSATIPATSFSGDGIAAPPSGSMSATLAAVTSTFVGNSIGGDVNSTLPAVTSAFEGSVNPIGAFECTIPSITSALVGETKPFGEHVILVEPDHRAFRIPDDDGEPIPIKRSQVTDA